MINGLGMRFYTCRSVRFQNYSMVIMIILVRPLVWTTSASYFRPTSHPIPTRNPSQAYIQFRLKTVPRDPLAPKDGACYQVSRLYHPITGGTACFSTSGWHHEYDQYSSNGIYPYICFFNLNSLNGNVSPFKFAFRSQR